MLPSVQRVWHILRLHLISALCDLLLVSVVRKKFLWVELTETTQPEVQQLRAGTLMSYAHVFVEHRTRKTTNCSSTLEAHSKTSCQLTTCHSLIYCLWLHIKGGKASCVLEQCTFQGSHNTLYKWNVSQLYFHDNLAAVTWNEVFNHKSHTLWCTMADTFATLFKHS